MAQSSRIHSLDRLRAFVVILVIVLHTSVTYMVGAPDWWYVLEQERSLFFTALALLIDVPIMPALFFLAGYFGLPSLVKRGPKLFLRDKLVRIGIPWILGVLFIAPLVTYLTYLSRGIPVSFLKFWTSDFWGDMYQQAVYWYLGVLLFLFLIVAVFYGPEERYRTVTQRPSVPSWTLLSGFVAVTTAGFLFMNQYFPLDSWVRLGHVLVVQPLRVPLDLAYFALGVYAYQHGWFTSESYQPSLVTWGLMCATSGVLYSSYRLTYPPGALTSIGPQTANAALFNSFCFSSLMAGLALFRRAGPIRRSVWTSLAQNSYGIYYVHPVFVYPLTYLFLSLSLPIPIKAAAVIVLGTLLSWACSALVLQKAPILRTMFARSGT